MHIGYIRILDNFLLPSIENWFSDDEAILMSQSKKGLKLFLGKKYKFNDMAKEQSGSKSNGKIMMEIFKNGP